MLISRKYLPLVNRCSGSALKQETQNDLQMCFPNLKLHHQNEERCLRKMKVSTVKLLDSNTQSFSPLTRWHDSNMQRFRDGAAKFNNRK